MTDHVRRGIRSAQFGMLVNAALAAVKLVAGIVGNTYALVADAVESTADILASAIVWVGISVGGREPVPARGSGRRVQAVRDDTLARL